MLVRQPTSSVYCINRNLALMNDEKKLKELQEKIWQLSADISSNQYQLRLLQAELDSLKEDAGQIDHKKIADQKTEFHKVSPSSFSDDGGLENYIGLRLIHLVGIVVLVIGLSIGVKYAIDKQLISEIMRVLLAYCAGIALFILSLRLKKKYQLFSAILFSGSMANIPAYNTDLCRMAAFIVDRRSCIQLEKIIWSCLHTHVPVECTYHLVDLECKCSGCTGSFFCQQSYHVYSLAAVLFYKKKLWQMDRLRIVYYLLAYV